MDRKTGIAYNISHLTTETAFPNSYCDLFAHNFHNFKMYLHV